MIDIKDTIKFQARNFYLEQTERFFHIWRFQNDVFKMEENKN